MRVFVGIIAVLVVVFAGGCSLIFIGAALYEWARGTSNAFMNMDAAFAIGVVPAVMAGVIAWLCFRRPPADNEEGEP